MAQNYSPWTQIAKDPKKVLALNEAEKTLEDQLGLNGPKGEDQAQGTPLLDVPEDPIMSQEAPMSSPASDMAPRAPQALPSIPQPPPGMRAKSMSLRVPMPSAQSPDGEAGHIEEIKRLLSQYDDSYNQSKESAKKGVGDLENQLNQIKSKSLPIDFSAALAYLDSYNGNDTAAHYKPPETKEQRDEKLFALQALLQDKKSAISKQDEEYIKSKLGLLVKKEDPLDDLVKYARINYLNAGGNPASRQSDRLAQQAHNAVVARVENDPTSRTKLQQIQTIDNASATMNEHATPSQFKEFQQAVISAANRGNSGIAERADRYMSSAGIEKAKIQQWLTGTPVEITDKAMVNAVRDFARVERANIKQQRDSILDAHIKGSGQAHIYAAHPEMKKSLEEQVKALKNLGDDNAGAPQVGDIVDGHKFLGGDPADPKSWGQ